MGDQRATSYLLQRLCGKGMPCQSWEVLRAIVVMVILVTLINPAIS